MEPKLHYATVSEAIDQLRSDGYVIDFSLSGNQLTSGEEKFDVEDFEIGAVYRYEGDTPADEAMVYALKAANGIKGILVAGYGISTDSEFMDVLNKMSRHKNDR